MLIGIYGTPQTMALSQKLTEDKIPGTSPGFGIAASADGSRYAFLFSHCRHLPFTGTAAVKFVKDQLGGNLKGKKIAYLFYDNPSGKEPFRCWNSSRPRKASSCVLSPSRRRASRWVPRFSISPSATGPIL